MPKRAATAVGWLIVAVMTAAGLLAGEGWRLRKAGIDIVTG